MFKQNHHKIISVEAQEIWALNDVKNYLRISHDYDDKLISTLIKAAIETAEIFTGLSFYKRTIISRINTSDKTRIYLHMSPILALNRMVCLYANESKNILDNYGQIDSSGHSLQLNSEFLYKNLEIEYIAGFGENIPHSLLHGILMHIASMYDHTEMAAILSPEIKELYLPYRNIGV